MQDTPVQRPSAAVQPVLTGKELDRRIRRIKDRPAALALVADKLRTGQLQVVDLTDRQVRALVPASFGYLNTIRNLSPTDRKAVENGGTSLSELHRRRCRKALTIAQIDRLVAADPDAVMAALDRYTETRQAAE
jgi:hypothetical protein